ncbi:hypothetical protein Slin15195_G115090 [Septoria linicola]|uniref:Uncharacterized protein n=1 Tax=Septoria linicola TaxID=215465 RepID=A0A9Q9AZZ9_9PEZI|nr:hypothetical protein Slin15195_G115090 [Septoria linicola]
MDASLQTATVVLATDTPARAANLVTRARGAIDAAATAVFPMAANLRMATYSGFDADFTPAQPVSTSYVTADQQTTTITTTSTSTTTVPAATATQIIPYNKQYERTDSNNCFYDYDQGYLSYGGVRNDDPTNNYQAGRTDCATNCNNNPQCGYFVFSQSTVQGITAGYCFVLAGQYSSASIACGKYDVQTTYIAAYNKGQ